MHQYITLMRLLAAEPRRNPGPFLSILPTPYSMMLDLRVSRAMPIHFYSPKLFAALFSLLFSLFLLSFYGLRYCGAGVCELIGCKSLSPNLALPTFFNNNNNNRQNSHTSKNQNIDKSEVSHLGPKLNSHNYISFVEQIFL